MATKIQDGGLDLSNVSLETARKVKDFVKSVPETKFLQPDGKPKQNWKMFYGRTWEEAQDNASICVTHAVANGAKVHKSWYNVNSVARDAAIASRRLESIEKLKNIVRNSLDHLKENLPNDIVWNAAFDAGAMASFIFLSDVDFKDKEKHSDDVKARWEVWQKGYGLACDVDGILYVYCKDETKSTSELLRSNRNEK